MSGNYNIQTGVIWTDYSTGIPILTLDQTTAGVLQAAIPLWITLASQAGWTIIRRIWYHARHRRLHRAPGQSLYEWQVQTLVRQSHGNFQMLVDAFGMLRAWRTLPPAKERHVRRSSLRLMIGVFLYWSIWLVCGILAFYIWQSQVTPNALIHSPDCGYGVYGKDGATDFDSTETGLNILADNWVSQCYGASVGDISACKLYPSRAIQYHTVTGVECPFAQPEFCIQEHSAPIRIISQWIDSQSDLGLNTPPEDRIKFQKITTCSPVVTTQFMEVVVNTTLDDALPQENVLRFYFGPAESFKPNYTYEFNTAPDDESYSLISISYSPPPADPTESTWTQPNATFLARGDADASLFFLHAGAVLYNYKTLDPWYQATVPLVPLPNNTVWQPNDIATVLGCIDQYRVCPNGHNETETGACTKISGQDDILQAVGNNTIALNDAQKAIATILLYNTRGLGTQRSVIGRSSSALLASRTVEPNMPGVYQAARIPQNQWQLEAEHWFAISMAKLQRYFIDYAGGPSLPMMKAFSDPATDAAQLALCKQQLVGLPSGYVNFNFGAMMGVLIAGSLVMLLGIFFDGLFARYLRWRGVTGQSEWLHDSPFQLQRVAYRGKYQDVAWSNEDTYVPVSEARLPHLAADEREHLLEAARSECESSDAKEAHVVESARLDPYGTTSQRRPRPAPLTP